MRTSVTFYSIEIFAITNLSVKGKFDMSTPPSIIASIMCNALLYI